MSKEYDYQETSTKTRVVTDKRRYFVDDGGRVIEQKENFANDLTLTGYIYNKPMFFDKKRKDGSPYKVVTFKVTTICYVADLQKTYTNVIICQSSTNTVCEFFEKLNNQCIIGCRGLFSNKKHYKYDDVIVGYPNIRGIEKLADFPNEPLLK